MNEQPFDLDSEKLISQEDLRARYQKLCSVRDLIETRIRPLRTQLEDARNAAERARVYSEDISAQLSAARGGQQWFILKKNIGTLAKLLGGK